MRTSGENNVGGNSRNTSYSTSPSSLSSSSSSSSSVITASAKKLFILHLQKAKCIRPSAKASKFQWRGEELTRVWIQGIIVKQSENDPSLFYVDDGTGVIEVHASSFRKKIPVRHMPLDIGMYVMIIGPVQCSVPSGSIEGAPLSRRLLAHQIIPFDEHQPQSESVWMLEVMEFWSQIDKIRKKPSYSP